MTFALLPIAANLLGFVGYDKGIAMEGLFLIAIGIALYFLPWVVATVRNHPNTTGIGILNLFLGWTVLGWVGALVWSFSAQDKTVSRSGQEAAPDIPDRPADKEAPDPSLQMAARNIRSIVGACMDACPDQFRLMVLLAQSNGKVSRSDLQIIVRACRRFGAVIDEAWLLSLGQLNSGVSISVSGDASCETEFLALSSVPLIDLAFLYGSMVALSIGSARGAKRADELLARLEVMIGMALDRQSPVVEAGPLKVVVNMPDDVPEETITEQVSDPVKAPVVSGWVAQAKAELAAERRG